MIVLDTHALLWWVNGDTARLSPAALAAIQQELLRGPESGQIMVSCISSWELAMLVSRERVALSMDVAAWLKLVAEIPNVSFVPVDNEIALRSTQLPGTFHKDPADRMIVATAVQCGAPLVTADEKILGYPHVRTIW